MTSAGCGLAAEDADKGAINAVAAGDVFDEASRRRISHSERCQCE